MSKWDDDIAALSLTDLEKNGLQLYRNYRRAFDNHAEKEFAKEVDAQAADLSDLRRVLVLVASEDSRFVPVIACAYVDERLKEMFGSEVPRDIPGGKANLFGPYGPFSDLFKRLQLAFAFDLLSRDLVVDLNKLREVRNKLSHNWDITALQDFLVTGPAKDVTAVEDLLAQRVEWLSNTDALSDAQKFRCRVAWILTRLTYECWLFPKARRARLSPSKALYGDNHPKRLTEVTRLAMDITQTIVASPTAK